MSPTTEFLLAMTCIVVSIHASIRILIMANAIRANRGRR